MKKHIKYSLILTVSVFMCSCNKQGAGCFTKAGENVTVAFNLLPFHSFDVATNVDVRLVQANEQMVEVTTGQNLIEGISLKVEDSVLYIENLNTCFWSKGYERPVVTLYSNEFKKIHQHGYGTIETIDTLIQDNIYIQAENASGEINLIVQVGDVQVVTNCIAPITLSGKAVLFRPGVYWSDGILDAQKLEVTNCRINHNGSNKLEVNVTGSLTGSINSIGNLYEYGQAPQVTEVLLTDTGKIIPMY